MKMFFVLLLATQLVKALGMICADGTDTSTYAGNISITDDGRVCQQWHEQRPHQHVFDDSDFLQDSSIIDAKNFCRNPSDGGDSWCLTSDPFHRWGYCYGRICGEDNATCGGKIQTSGSYQIKYFNKMIPGLFETDKNCLWTLQAPIGKLVSLTFVMIENECDQYTYIQIYEAGFNHGKVCSNNSIATSKSNMLYIRLQCFNCLDGGFHVMVHHMVPPNDTKVLDPNCGGVITESQAIIQNRDRDGDGMYDIIDYCVWNIVAPVDTLIKIDIEMLELEFEIECRSDFLEVYDTTTVYARLCGETAPGLSLVSNYSNVYLRFFSDFIKTGRGFRLAISHIIIAMVHHDSPQFELHSKLGEDLDVKKKIQHHYMAIDFDLTNTAKPGLTGIKEENIAPIRFKHKHAGHDSNEFFLNWELSTNDFGNIRNNSATQCY